MKKITLPVLAGITVLLTSSFADYNRPSQPAQRPPVQRPPVVVVPAPPVYSDPYYGGNTFVPPPVIGNGCSMHYIDNEFVRDCRGSVSHPYYGGGGGVVYR